MPKPRRLIITIRGGLLSEVYTDCNEPMDVDVIDFDCINDPEYEKEKWPVIEELANRSDLTCIY